MEDHFEFEAAKEFVLEKLKQALSNDLVYHSVEHTLDVVEAARLFGEMENLDGKDLRLLETAALFHDIGFIEAYLNHEASSIKIARKVLPDYGYTQNDIDIISGLIEATKLPQKPQNHLEEILADADLNYLGRDDMFIIGQRLHYECGRYGHKTSLRDWHKIQLKFLKQHRYFTKSATQLREAKKQENIREIEDLLRVGN